VLCWAALDRLLELHHGGVLPRAPIERYRVQREAIRREIEEQAWNRRLVSYVRRPGGEELDATLLLLPLYGYLKPDSWRMRQTYQRVQERLGAGRGLLYRYRGDENPGEGAFGICSFWGAQYLADGGGSLQEAHEIFDQVLEFANDVGLYGEEIDPGTGGALGNFPQGFTHVGVINAALAIQARTARERLLPEEAVLAPERIGAEGAHL
jgi:GH15 family glucan-1,4-alpha-glucosidase